jgi:hypothetical protein
LGQAGASDVVDAPRPPERRDHAQKGAPAPVRA